MSQSTESEEAEGSGEGAVAQKALTRMIATGRAFSGRERNVAFLNLGDGTFASVASVTGLDATDDARALAVVDWDRDGDLDLWWSSRTGPQIRFLRNDAESGHHSISFRLQGDGRGTNRDAIGARVRLVLAPSASPQVATLRAGEGFLAQSSKWMHFGLAGYDGALAADVRWPGGDVERFQGLAAGGRHVLQQGTGEARPAPSAPRTSPPRAVPPPDVAKPTYVRARMGLLLPLGDVPVMTFDGALRPLGRTAGRPMLLNLWASWCSPCLAELRELTERRQEIAQAGIDVVALAVNGLGDDDSDPADAAAFLDSIEFPFSSGRASAALMEKLQTIHDLQMVVDTPLPVPTSVLLDRSGRVAVVYRGAVPVDDLLADGKQLGAARDDRWPRSAALPGRILEHEPLPRVAQRSELALRLHFARDLEANGAWSEASPHYRDAVAFSPGDARLRGLLGMSLARSGQLEEATVELEEAVRLDPDNAEFHNNLGSVLARHGRVAEAVRQFERALEIDPSLDVARSNLARARASLEGR